MGQYLRPDLHNGRRSHPWKPISSGQTTRRRISASISCFLHHANGQAGLNPTHPRRTFLKDGVVTELFRGENVQGLWDDGDDLYAIEDRKPFARLLRYRWSDQSLTVLRDRVQEGSDPVVFSHLKTLG